MIPDPKELIKEALQSGPAGVFGRQHAPGSMARYMERQQRRSNVSDRMRFEAVKQPGGPTNAQRDKFLRSSAKGLKDAQAFSKAFDKSIPGIRDQVRADFKRRQRSANRKALGIGLGAAGLAAGAYALHKRKKANEAKAKAEAEGQAKMAAKTPAWTRSEGKSESGGLNAKGVASYRRANPGSKLQTAVTTKPSKLKPGSKAAKRRKSFCSRMSGVKGPMKDEKGRPTRKALSLRRWNC